MKILGIDLSANETKESGICLLDNKLRAKTFSLFSNKEILELMERISPKIVAIDAPIALPENKKRAFREAEREILKLGIKILPPKWKSMKKLAKRGNFLFQMLRKKFKVIEVFPHATKEILEFSSDFSNLKREISKKLGVHFLNQNPIPHEIDAFFAAYTGYLFLRKKTRNLGKKREGQIVIPKREKRFLNAKIDLSKKVFFPREETQFWTKRAIKKIQKEKSGASRIEILDIFAGSGCIGISLLKNLKNSFVDFVDIDPEAISQIKFNLKLNKISPRRYFLFQANLFQKLGQKKYDFIFANPPYVARERIFEVQERVRKFEPRKAWDGGKEGLVFIKKFLKKAKNYLRDGGKIFLEIDPFQRERVSEILKKENYKKFCFLKDQFRRIRWVEITK